ncbi:unnamed protein product [Peniophora sp. CBMAI 1063]|nr:unnamed protein product [Peniophora sp. CBMAI 1063]
MPRLSAGRASDISESVDPLDLLAAPPKDETSAERAVREAKEAEAKRVSDAIDDQLKQERVSRSKKKAPVKVLLLGQSESGKSTIVKNFQIAYAHQAWSEQRASWRSVVFLNLVRSVNVILDNLSREMSQLKSSNSQQEFNLRLAHLSSGTELSDSDSDIRSNDSPLHRRTTSRPAVDKPLPFSEYHRLLQLRLGPLRRVQADLERRLSVHEDDIDTVTISPTPFVALEQAGAANKRRSLNLSASREFFVRSRSGWKGALGWAKGFSSGKPKKGRERDGDDALDVLLGCKDDIVGLWQDPLIRKMLRRRQFDIEDTPGFFLDDVSRIIDPNYEPSDADVVRARLRTLGVQEYPFTFEKGSQVGREWVMYDVGGARSCRSAWYPYFMDVNAIIFLAPISVFDESLDEDPTVNRLEDTYLLWKAVVSSKLLSKVQLILFLNKCDILERKLERGASITRFIPTYGDRDNDMQTAAKYFRKQFKDMLKKYSPVQRQFFCYLTTAIDTKSTMQTLAVVREGLMRELLQKADLMQPL